MDREYLGERAYPWFKEVAIYFEEIPVRGEDGKRKLPISSSQRSVTIVGKHGLEKPPTLI